VEPKVFNNSADADRWIVDGTLLPAAHLQVLPCASGIERVVRLSTRSRHAVADFSNVAGTKTLFHVLSTTVRSFVRNALPQMIHMAGHIREFMGAQYRFKSRNRRRASRAVGAGRGPGPMTVKRPSAIALSPYYHRLVLVMAF